MAKFTETIKERSRIIWTKVRPYGSFLVSLLLVAVIAGTTYSLVHKNKNENTNQPTINEQGLNPRIGDALAPDVNPEAQQNTNTPAPDTGKVASDYTAPKTGIDDNAPVEYWSDRWQFSATLPPHTTVNETEDGVNFVGPSNEQYYSVNISPAGKEILQSLSYQLRNSPEVKNISILSDKITFELGSQNGIAIIKHNFIYYITGNKYLETFRIK